MAACELEGMNSSCITLAEIQVYRIYIHIYIHINTHVKRGGREGVGEGANGDLLIFSTECMPKLRLISCWCVVCSCVGCIGGGVYGTMKIFVLFYSYYFVRSLSFW